eukprot:CAMPEP_0174253658 /NCGR_PEP_ID=MMETSP0439-20130205/3024_1 /TAXON_ID=0 /ORGANISM="Stereomyxa ramosa, Strain Chinc5" /LENGTH=344 /DNA_ID=CAMNT_0015334805 /DNA_START=42 /DNA_END=1076 /DNA_ORIENTATION=-
MEAAPAHRVDHLLFLLQKEGRLDTSTLLKRQDQSLKQFYDSLQGLVKKGWCEFEGDDVVLTEEGKKQLPETEEGYKEFYNRCSTCETRGYQTPEEFEKLGLLREITRGRPRAREEFDQWYMTPKHALHRVAFMHSHGDLLNKKILLIGDDDLLSVAAALTGLPSEVVALEVDQRLIDFINKVAKENNLKLRAQTYDARHDLDEKFLSHFDVFACDPVETVEGCRVFLSRGVSGLKGPNCSVYFGLTTMECSKKKWLEIQKKLHSMNLTITDIVRNFTEYPDPGWEERLPIWANLNMKPTGTWYNSAFYRLQICGEPKPSVVGDYKGEWDFFHDDDTWATTEEKI